MSEDHLLYHDAPHPPHPPPIDRTNLRLRIALFLRAGAGDPASRELLELASIALLQAEAAARCVGHCHQQLALLATTAERHFARIETALTAVENILISDGK